MQMMKLVCPLCKSYDINLTSDPIICNQCDSVFNIKENQYEIIKSGLKADDKTIWNIFLIFVFIIAITTIFINRTDKDTLSDFIIGGLFYITMPLILGFRDHFYYRFEDKQHYKSIFKIYMSMFNGILKYYDVVSKTWLFLCLFSHLLGLLLILWGIVKFA